MHLASLTGIQTVSDHFFGVHSLRALAIQSNDFLMCYRNKVEKTPTQLLADVLAAYMRISNSNFNASHTSDPSRFRKVPELEGGVPL